MSTQVNPNEESNSAKAPQKQTAELRSADCSADVYQLIAGMVVAARTGFEAENALKRAEEMYVSVNIHNDENKDKLAQLESLPDSCVASADALDANRADFEKYDVFSPALIDGIIKKLRKHKDANLRKKLEGNPKEMLETVRKFWHCG